MIKLKTDSKMYDLTLPIVTPFLLGSLNKRHSKFLLLKKKTLNLEKYNSLFD